MKFIKGVMLGSIITAGTMMMYSENIETNKKKMMRMGKSMAKKLKMVM